MAMDQFLELDGISGESRDKTHAGKIDILAWSWGMSNSGSAHSGGGQGAGKANVQDLSFTHYLDAATVPLLKNVQTGKHIAKGKLIVRKAGGTPLEYVLIELTDIIVTSYSTGGSGGEDRLTANCTLNFAKYKVSYQKQKNDGAKDGGPIEFEYSIAENAA